MTRYTVKQDEPLCLACHLAREFRLVSHTRCGGTCTDRGKLAVCRCRQCWPTGGQPPPTPIPEFGPDQQSRRRGARPRMPKLDRRLV